MLPTLLAAAPETYGRYYEPFCGSACLFLALAPRNAVLSDVNYELIDAYTALRADFTAVYSHVESFPQTRAFYYDLRDQDVDALSSIERAARFIYLNRYCFNGIYRTNKDGRFNVPFGTKTGAMPPRTAFATFAARLAFAELRNVDFEEAVSDAQRGDFVYLDPPYFSQRPTYGEYGYETFREPDLDRLFELVRGLSRRGVKVLLSYGGRDNLADQLPNFFATRLRVTRRLAAATKFRRSVYDCLLANYEVVTSA